MTVARIWLLKSIVPLLSICILGGIWGAWHFFTESESAEKPESVQVSEVRTEVQLSETKRQRAGLKLGRVEQRILQATAIVPGRVTYDESKHVELRSATAGTITKFLVKPGDQVKKGDLLAVLSSPEIGQSRAAEKQQAAELELLNRTLSFQRERLKGIEALTAAIDRGDAPERIRESKATEQIGAPREALLTAYSQMLLAKSQIRRISGATGSGAIAGRTAAERESQLETAEASLRGSMEQILFDSKQEVAKAMTAVETAQRQLELTRQQTATLMGYQSAIELPSRQDSPGDNLSTVEVRAPLDGSVEQKLLAETERVSPGDGLLILADTSNLWIKAQLRESQWRGLALKPGDILRVASPALGSERLDASVYFVGREVDQATNAIPIVATIENDGRLRPGLFVNVELPIGDKNKCLAVPESAIATHELLSFVFVPLDENTFKRRDVEIGERCGGWVEVRAGLAFDEAIAIDGIFFLKSELLLEAED
jgi:cobalt-zinc-cadmium efflux system membrane fusion protein